MDVVLWLPSPGLERHETVFPDVVTSAITRMVLTVGFA
jgi:hypothetical protein